MPWHSMSPPPALGVNVVLRGAKGGMYLGSRMETRAGKDLYYVPNHRYNHFYPEQFVAWHDIEPFEGVRDGATY